MLFNRKKSLEEYTQALRENNAEVEQLYQGLLINVTSFFRDTAIYKALKKKILPAIIKDRKPLDIIRIWIARAPPAKKPVFLPSPYF